nr:MAG: hypothetical protein [Bacteriophage sp.]
MEHRKIELEEVKPKMVTDLQDEVQEISYQLKAIKEGLENEDIQRVIYGYYESTSKQEIRERLKMIRRATLNIERIFDNPWEV